MKDYIKPLQYSDHYILHVGTNCELMNWNVAELKLRSENWLINCSYKPNKNAIGNLLEALTDLLDFLSSSYTILLS